MDYKMDLIIKILLSIFLVRLFYLHIKSFAFSYAGKIAVYFNLNYQYSFETAKGVIELLLIVSMHFIFCIFLLNLSKISFPHLGVSFSVNPTLLFKGFLLGIGVMGASSLLGRFYIELMKSCSRYFFPEQLKNWLTMARGGWIRHHFHTLEVLPIPMALAVTLGQVIAEEIVFRGVCINYFSQNGNLIALMISTLLFMYMQIFHMPNKTSAVFPVIGALVFGLVGGILYLHVHTLLPLIIAHITFFSVAVL